MTRPMNRRELPQWIVASTIGGLAMLGCRASSPGGTPIAPLPIGTVLDEANRAQEENAEAAKLIVYMHEFELNVPFSITGEMAHTEKFAGVPRDIARGFRLTPFGQDHVRQIARELTDGTGDNKLVVVERSNTSKNWITQHRYPVHWNTELDNHRRQLVVESLTALGVERANEKVQIAPAFPEGLSSQEAAAAYMRSRTSNSSGGSGGGQQGRGGNGSGIGGSFGSGSGPYGGGNVGGTGFGSQTGGSASF